MTNELTYKGLNQMLFDQYLASREAVGWCLNRIISGRDGVDLVCESKIV